MEIRIAINNNPGVQAGMPSGETCAGHLAEMTQKHLAHIGPAMPNRDANVLIGNLNIAASILSWKIEKNPRKNDRLELVINIGGDPLLEELSVRE